MADTQTAIEAAVRQELTNTPYEPSQLETLSGGTANFIFRATLKEPLQDGTTHVAIKHGEGFVAQMPGFALTTSRCTVEAHCLRELADFPAVPILHHFNTDTNTQVQELIQGSIPLKEYALRYLNVPSPEALKPLCHQQGKFLGKWLRELHTLGQPGSSHPLREVAMKNAEMQQLKLYINYQGMEGMFSKYPDILGDMKDLWGKVSTAAKEETRDASSLHVIHGDFWTGNVLIPDGPLTNPEHARIIDWELVQLGKPELDLGQMIAELWQLKLFKDIDAGLWIIEGLIDGYYSGSGQQMIKSDESLCRTLLHVGAHLICFGSTTPGWGDEGQREEVVRAAKEIIVMACEGDGGAFGDHQLGFLFA